MISTGTISGTPTTVGTYTGTITATDKVNVARQITSAFSFNVTDGYYNARGFSLTPPYHHRDTDTLYDLDGYNDEGFNKQGYNAAMEYNAAYDEEASPS